MTDANKLKTKYIFLQSFYWLLFCPGIAYMNTFLTFRGQTPAAIGLISAAAGTVSALVQPALGKLADQNEHFSWKVQLCFMAFLCALCNILMFPVKNLTATSMLYALFFMLLYAMMPFLNGAAFYYETCGINLNFGFARGMGSLFYAVGALLMGKCVAEYGAQLIPAISAAVSALLVILGASMPYRKNFAAVQTASVRNEKTASPVEFFQNNPGFIMMLVAFALLITFHNMTNTFMLQIVQRAGGADTQMGAAVALAAVTELIPLFMFSKLIKKFSSAGLLFTSAIFFFLKAVMLFAAHSMDAIYFAQSLQMLGYGLFTPASVYYAKEAMTPDKKMQGQSLLAGAITLGGVIGNLIGGVIIQNSGVEADLLTGVFVTLAAAALVGAFGLKRKHFPGNK